jgi:hypothetical protein
MAMDMALAVLGMDKGDDPGWEARTGHIPDMLKYIKGFVV